MGRPAGAGRAINDQDCIIWESHGRKQSIMLDGVTRGWRWLVTAGESIRAGSGAVRHHSIM